MTNNVVELLNRRLRRGQDRLGVVIDDAAAHRYGAGAWRPLSPIIAREGAMEVDRAASIVASRRSIERPAHESGVVHRDVKPANFGLDARIRERT